MKPLEKVFRSAAKGVFNSERHEQECDGLDVEFTHWAACPSIAGASNQFSVMKVQWPAQAAFTEVFREDAVHSLWWFGAPWSKSKRINHERMEHRVFALLILAELAKDQGV